MDTTTKFPAIFYIFCFSFIALCANTLKVYAQQEPTSVEVNGDNVEFSIAENKVVAEGHVRIVRQDTTLTCDRLEYYRDSKIAVAEGHVVVTMKEGEMKGDRLKFNFETMKGDFNEAHITSRPFYGAGQEVSKVGENHIVMKRGYLTTCDLDEPHFRMVSRKVDVYPREKAVARNAKLVVGKVPLLYVPRYTQLLNGEPRFVITPGYDKQWGAFALTQWKYQINDNFKGTIHFDAREKKDISSGFDIKYNMAKMGNGIIRTYYMNERSITSKHFYQPRPSPTIERERFKAEWRHKVEIDKNTDAILQYYKLSDDGLLKDYFKKENRLDSNPPTYFLLTRHLSKGTFSFRTDKRVNRFVGGVERLPELQYDLSSQAIANTGLFFRSTNVYSNLSKKDASPTEIRKETMRVHTDNEISYPIKISFIEFQPRVGGQHAYYSKALDPDNYNSIRGAFRTGADLSTKFYKVFDFRSNLWGIEINRLRHIVTPTVTYNYQHDPTIPDSQYDQIDSLDSMQRNHTITFALENKLQTKRNLRNVDLLRAIVSTDFRLKDMPGTGGFDQIKANVELKPTDYLVFALDSTYNTHRDKIQSVNFDLNTSGARWSFDFGKRFDVDADDQITSEFKYKINPKWRFRIYERFDALNGLQKEQEFTVTRDLHEWEMDINFNETKGQGDEIWIVFRLKAFPEMGLFDLGTGFNKRKTGSQSSVGN